MELNEFRNELIKEAALKKQAFIQKQHKLNFDKLLQEEKKLFKIAEVAKYGIEQKEEESTNELDVIFKAHWMKQIKEYDILKNIILEEACKYNFKFQFSEPEMIRLYKKLDKDTKSFHTTKTIYLRHYGGLYWIITDLQPLIGKNIGTTIDGFTSDDIICIPRNIKIAVCKDHVKLEYELSQRLIEGTKLIQDGTLEMKDYIQNFLTKW